MFGLPHGSEWIIILILALLIFGPSKIPALAKSVGKAITEFRKGVKGVEDDVKTAVTEKPSDESTKPNNNGAGS